VNFVGQGQRIFLYTTCIKCKIELNQSWYNIAYVCVYLLSQVENRVAFTNYFHVYTLFIIRNISNTSKGNTHICITFIINNKKKC
jgi:hypothetical protein